MLSVFAIVAFIFGTMPRLIAISWYQKCFGKSIDPEDNLSLYYKKNDSDVKGDVVYNDWGLTKSGWRLWHTFNIKSTNPTNYQYINFLGNESDFFSKVSWGDNAYFGNKLNKYNSPYNDNSINNKMINAKILNPNYDIPRIVRNESRFFVQTLYTQYLQAYLSATQLFALTWYYEYNNYYIQVFTYHWVRATGSYIYGGIWLGIGTGIILFME